MTVDDAARLLVEVRAMYPAMTIVPKIADAWESVLGGYDLDDCRTALTTWGMTESRIPAPADVRRVILAGRQDTRMRELPGNPSDLIPMPDWFYATVAEHKRRTHEANAERAAAGLAPDFGGQVAP